MRIGMLPPRKALGLAVLAVALQLGPAAAAEGDSRDPVAVRRAEQDIARLRADLAKVNAEVAGLKRAGRSIRNDYRLRERMADAEALAQKLTAAEAQLRAKAQASGPLAAGAPVVASPQASPQDGSVELEAKADLLLDQARKLDGEAALLSKAADQVRSRKALRRKAGGWDRDPFAGLETSRRNVVMSPASSSRATAGEAAPATGSGSQGGGATFGPGSAPPPAVTSTTMDTAAKGASAPDGSAASKTSPLVSSAGADRQAVEQRLYLDPATAAELRHALGAGGASLEPEALERGAVALRARARLLETQARTVRAQIRAP
jgi:hypothetical protein